MASNVKIYINAYRQKKKERGRRNENEVTIWHRIAIVFYVHTYASVFLYVCVWVGGCARMFALPTIHYTLLLLLLELQMQIYICQLFYLISYFELCEKFLNYDFYEGNIVGCKKRKEK